MTLVCTLSLSLSVQEENSRGCFTTEIPPLYYVMSKSVLVHFFILEFQNLLEKQLLGMKIEEKLSLTLKLFFHI